jgi:hypothetical protein
MAERLVPLCQHVPPGELAELTARLAASELMRTGALSASVDDPAPPVGNQVVWLSGASGAAIILPAGEEDPAPLASMSQLLERTRQHARRAGEYAADRGWSVRQRLATFVNAWQARPRTRLPDR